MSLETGPACERGRVGDGGGRGAWLYCDVKENREGLLRTTGAGVVLSGGSGFESGSVEAPEMVDPVLRFLLLTVTDAGTVVVVDNGVGVMLALLPIAEPERGDARGGVLTGAGSFDRAV